MFSMDKYTGFSIPETIKIKNGKRTMNIYPVPAAFDIETTNDSVSESAYMYHWQFAVGENIFTGRTWDDFFMFIDYLTQPSYYCEGCLIVYIHNMDFEMSFLMPRLYEKHMISRTFAKDAHTPLEVELKNGVIFRDSKALTNMSLASLAKNYTKTQKLVGDLDYTIPRNSTTPLTETEKQYCYNDVIILKEYAEMLHNEYTKKGLKIPLTSTGIVRQYVKNSLPKNKIYSIQKGVEKLFPKTEEQYKNTMRWLFRGGYTHAQTGACDEILTNVISYDFTSAYPSVMIHNLFPKSPFTPLRCPNEKRVRSLIDAGRGVIMLVDFHNIKVKGSHCVESKHKIIQWENPIFENGRLYKADRILVLITDADLDIYDMFYEWSEMRIISAKTAHMGRLPSYLYNSVLHFYGAKKQLKQQVKDEEKTGVDSSETRKLLQKVKGMLNSCYGMTVSRLYFGTWDYDINSEDPDNDAPEWFCTYDQSYEELKKQQILSPYWGIYVTAYCRRNILTAIKHFGDYAIYSDTDSIKILNTAPGLYEYFEQYNDIVMKRNKDICYRFGLDPDIYTDLGIFDCEGTYDKFKTLGAKRYIYTKYGKTEAVIAGLPKKATDLFIAENGADALYDKFAPGMWFEIACKNAHKYSGETSANIAGEIMHELGSCYIYPTSFMMTVEDAFLSQISERKEIFKNATNG